MVKDDCNSSELPVNLLTLRTALKCAFPLPSYCPSSSPSILLPSLPLPAPVRVQAAPDQPVQLHRCQAAGRQLCGQVLPPLPLTGGAGAGLLVRPAGRRGLSGEGRGQTTVCGRRGQTTVCGGEGTDDCLWGGGGQTTVWGGRGQLTKAFEAESCNQLWLALLQVCSRAIRLKDLCLSAGLFLAASVGVSLAASVGVSLIALVGVSLLCTGATVHYQVSSGVCLHVPRPHLQGG